MNWFEGHEAAVGSGSEAHGDHVAGAQLHPQVLQLCQDEHAQGVLQDGRMPSVKSHKLRRDAQLLGSSRAQSRQGGHLCAFLTSLRLPSARS
jgi:hypothetical protein